MLTGAKKGLKEPYDWDEYAQMYFPKAEELSKIAEEAENAGEKEKASEYYLYGNFHSDRIKSNLEQPQRSRLSYRSFSRTSIREAKVRVASGDRNIL